MHSFSQAGKALGKSALGVMVGVGSAGMWVGVLLPVAPLLWEHFLVLVFPTENLHSSPFGFMMQEHLTQGCGGVSHRCSLHPLHSPGGMVPSPHTRYWGQVSTGSGISNVTLSLLVPEHFHYDNVFPFSSFVWFIWSLSSFWDRHALV